jgi:hypothetical protein
LEGCVVVVGVVGFVVDDDEQHAPQQLPHVQAIEDTSDRVVSGDYDRSRSVGDQRDVPGSMSSIRATRPSIAPVSAGMAAP